MRDYLALRRLEDIAKDEKKPVHIKKRLTLARRAWRTAYLTWIKPFFQWLYDNIRWIERMPYSVRFTIFLLFLFFCGFFYTKWAYALFRNDVITALPELVQSSVDEYGVVHISPLDAFHTAFVARRQAETWFWLTMLTGVGFMLIWKSKNPRKPQSFHLYGYTPR